MTNPTISIKSEKICNNETQLLLYCSLTKAWQSHQECLKLLLHIMNVCVQH